MPSQWRRALIHPIAKSSATAAAVDYRPISITPVLSRILEEQVVRNFIYPTMPTAPSLLSFSDQYAFRPTGSTTSALVALLHKITTLLLTNSFVVVIVVDSELSTGRMDPRVGSGRVTILPDFGGSGRVVQHFGFFSFLLIISWYLNRCESSNTTFGLIDFLRYLI